MNESPIAGRKAIQGIGASRALFKFTLPVTFNWSCPFAPGVVPLILTAVVCYPLIQWMLPDTILMNQLGGPTVSISSMNVFYSVLLGLLVGGVISAITEYYTGMDKKAK